VGAVRPLACKAAKRRFLSVSKARSQVERAFCRLKSGLLLGGARGGRGTRAGAEARGGVSEAGGGVSESGTVAHTGAGADGRASRGLADGAGIAADHGEVGSGVVEELPLVVVGFLMPDEDGGLGAVGGEAHDAQTADGGAGARCGAGGGRCR